MCIYLSNASYFQVWRLYTWPRRIRRYWSLLPCLPFHIHHHPLDIDQGQHHHHSQQHEQHHPMDIDQGEEVLLLDKNFTATPMIIIISTKSLSSSGLFSNIVIVLATTLSAMQTQ